MILPLMLLMAGALAITSAAPPADLEPEDLELSASIIEKVGSKLADYIEAYREGDDDKKTDRAYKAFLKEFESASKKTKAKDLLAYCEDLSAILHASREWSKSGLMMRSVGKGKSENEIANWYYQVPKDYDPKKNVLPTLMVLLPAGADAKQLLSDETGWSTASLADSAVVVGIEMPKDADKYNQAMFVTLKETRDTFRVDHQRLIVAAEGNLVPYLLDVVNSTPHLFAGVVILNPSGELPELFNLGKFPVYLAGGSETTNQPYVEALKQVEAALVTGDKAGEKIAEWALAQRRDPYPKKFLFRPPGRRSSQAYWVRFVPEWSLGPGGTVDLDLAKRAQIEVESDRENNRITIRCKRITFIEILLNDEIVDLDKAISLNLNGKVIEFSKGRDLEYFLEYFKLFFDRGMVFTAFYSTRDIPPLEEPAEEKKTDAGGEGGASPDGEDGGEKGGEKKKD